MCKRIFVLASIGLAGFLMWGAGPVITDPKTGDRFQTVGSGELPEFALKASQSVQEAYRYAVAHPEVLQYVPCFCGCKNIGHRHNGDCYIKERHPDGRITFTSHAAG